MNVQFKDSRIVGSDELLGTVNVGLGDLASQRGMMAEFQLEGGSMAQCPGAITLEWQVPPAPPQQPQASAGSQVMAAVEGGGSAVPTAVAPQVPGQPPAAPAAGGGMIGSITQAVQSSNSAGAIYKTVDTAMGAYKEARQVPLPPCEGQTYAVRVTIHRARNLQSTEMDTRYDPLVEVSVLDQRKNTDYAKKTNNPIWEEELFFLLEKVSAGFWGESFQLTVKDHRIGMPNETIGIAALDLGALYQITPQHVLRRKWVPIVRSTTNGLVMGYVKMTVTILNTKTDPVPEIAEDEGNDVAEDDDIVNNLLDLPGTRFDEITLLARIVEAEELPAMDP
eukprot:PhF_6_TR7955/c0_g1_i2/m.12019